MPIPIVIRHMRYDTSSKLFRRGVQTGGNDASRRRKKDSTGIITRQDKKSEAFLSDEKRFNGLKAVEELKRDHDSRRRAKKDKLENKRQLIMNREASRWSRVEEKMKSEDAKWEMKRKASQLQRDRRQRGYNIISREIYTSTTKGRELEEKDNQTLNRQHARAQRIRSKNGGNTRLW
eukprot:g5897.t1